MGADEQKSPLLDFLYRDPTRIASFYAQLFGGLLSSTEISDGSKKAVESGGGGGFPGVAEGHHKRGNERTEGRKETITPNDVLVTDLITRMIADTRVFADHSAAKGGSFVRVSGVLYMLDASIIPIGLSAIDSVPGLVSKSDRGNMKAVRGAFEAMRIPSVFLLETDSGNVYGGTIKEAGLDEPIAAFNFKHGAEGLPGVVVLGVKEESKPLVRIPTDGLIKATQEFSKIIGRLVIPEAAMKLTPIAIYREL